jgi:hypothetical protein
MAVFSKHRHFAFYDFRVSAPWIELQKTNYRT